MPYAGNTNEWKALAKIDYFVQFTKCWLPFNAWYQNLFSDTYLDEKCIKKVIERVSNNPLRDRFRSLINSDNDGSKIFRIKLGDLKEILDIHRVSNRGEELSFNTIIQRHNSKNSEPGLCQHYEYEVIRVSKSKYSLSIKRRGTHVSHFSYTQIGKHDFSVIESLPTFQPLTDRQKNKLKGFYFEVRPKKIIEIVIDNSRGQSSYKCGNIYFVQDEALLFEAVLLILYKLRCSLFHGEIIPDSNREEVYHIAHDILAELIKAI